MPATGVDVDGNPKPFAPTRVVGIGPMGVASVSPTLTLRWQQGAGVLTWPFAQVTPMPYGAFPLGVWGPPQDAGVAEDPDRRGRAGAVASAADRAAVDSGGGPAIDYNRLDPPGPRRPLPFLRNGGAARTSELNQARAIGKLVADAAAADDVVVLADEWRARAGASAVELAAWKNERRTVAPLLGSLTDRLAKTDAVVVPEVAAPLAVAEIDVSVHAPVALAVLNAGTPLEGARAGGGTTVSDRSRGGAGGPALGRGAAQRAGGGAPRDRRRCGGTHRPVDRAHRRRRGHAGGARARREHHPARRTGAGPARRDQRHDGRQQGGRHHGARRGGRGPRAAECSA